ncbi:hypothetical protein SLEP1_g5958 [Rubroshorea leprosula]|uniref:Cation/H+ exchanger domain-containing protein n=1 Tax=Rubroshorea leprosula TaxID=152421 RepID=A0AAV5HZI9_9ROSI|nr:hypothetical protein SLEP1_g5958 [Rubroshorea leprosula]
MASDDGLEPQYSIDDGTCWRFQPVISEGFWNLKSGENIVTKRPLLLLEIQLALIFILTSTIHLCLRRLHFPRLLSEFLAGLFLGNSFLGRFYPNFSHALFPLSSIKLLVTLTRFGYLFFMFMIGMKMDVGLMMKSGKREWIIGSITNIFPSFVLLSIAKHISLKVDNIPPNDTTWVRIVSGAIMITSFPTVACLLMHLKIINSELGHLALSSALVANLMTVIMVSLLSWSHLLAMSSSSVAMKAMFLSISLVVFILAVLLPMMFWIVKRTPEGKPVKDSYICLVVIALLSVAVAGDNVGLQFLYGPFTLGLAVPTGPPLASVVVEKLDAIISGLMLPLLATICGYKTNLWELERRPPLYLVFLVTFGLLFKMALCFASAICFRMPHKDAAALALILTAKGVFELAIINKASEKMLHDPSKTYAGYQKRNVLNSCFNDGVRVLACAERQDDALAAIKLLEISISTKQSPMSVFGLYLEELKGGSTPLLLTHQRGQKSSCSDGFRWQPIIDVFNYFESQHKKLVNVRVFKAMSPAKLMHEDICWVAFVNSVVLIRLLFHRKWNNKGMMTADSKNLRTLNCNVLKKAPCSVGILIDRSRARYPSISALSPSYQIAVIYEGGNDDREALALARRMTGSTTVHLTTFRLLALNDDSQKEWDDSMDNAALRAFKHESAKNANLMYKEVIVEDGVNTTSFIGSLLEGDNFDLTLVGRRHGTGSRITAGLSEWSELPELGAIGELLASSDIRSTVSVLVVQQQII